MTMFDSEKQILKENLVKIDRILFDERLLLNRLYNDAKHDDELWNRIFMKQIHIKNIESSLDKPYFARIDFKYNDKKEIQTFYIGKHGISDDDEVVVTDWRAPISSLYYDSEIGECSFQAPEGIMNGNMFLKRQFEIEKGELIDCFDVNLVAKDALLQKYLSENNETRLKSIVATIQQEQNMVIRKKLADNIIVQGVAGSGKTTVALHRIAYLAYNYMKSVRYDQYMIIGPNPVFLKYIKSVLPELDVAEVSQLTFEEFAKDYINEDLIINSSEKKVTNSIEGKITNDIDKFKSSLKYKTMIDQFLSDYVLLLISKDLKIGDFVVMNHNVIKKYFNDIDKNKSMDIIIEQTISRLERYIKDNNDKILANYREYSDKLYNSLSNENEKIKMKKQFSKELEEIKKCCKNTIRKYFSETKIKTTKIYKRFVVSMENYDLYKYNNLKEMQRETLSNIKKGTYDFEDLSSLIYLRKQLVPNSDYKKIRHVVVDEAQDLGEFNFAVLKSVFESSTFSIFGDIAQSIYDYRGIRDWDVVNAVLFNNDAEIINFKKSYRTTSNIMQSADDVAEYIGLNRSDLVVRKGEPVTISSFENSDAIVEFIIKQVDEYKQHGYKTIAIISKTDKISENINNELSKRGLIIPNVSINDDLSDEKFKICTISNQLAKGLEFDAVIINNVSEDIYSSSNILDMKLLYVAITRALHKLDIIYTGNLTKPLIATLKKNN